MSRYSAACIEWLLPNSGTDRDDHVVAAKRARFDAVGFHLWRDTPMARRAHAIADHDVRVADTQGRHEPGTGGVAWDAAISNLGQMRYDGAIGFEYSPTLPDAESAATAKARIGL